VVCRIYRREIRQIERCWDLSDTQDDPPITKPLPSAPLPPLKGPSMRYAFMSFSTPELSLAEMLAVAKEYGYDGVEPRIDANHRHGIEVAASSTERAALRDVAAASGLALACLATSLTYADPAHTASMLAQTHARLDLAGDLGVPTLRVFGGAIPQGVSREEALALLVASLRRVADHAAERAVTLVLETHDDWCDPQHIAAVMQQVDHPAVAVNWDIMHPVRMGLASIDESFAVLAPWVRHLHIHDATDGTTLAPIGTGYIDHRRALELLASSRYDGFISGEWINWEDYRLHLPRELTTLKGYERATRG
jgi:sugar phosphate isomerase/epimerase